MKWLPMVVDVRIVIPRDSSEKMTALVQAKYMTGQIHDQIRDLVERSGLIKEVCAEIPRQLPSALGYRKTFILKDPRRSSIDPERSASALSAEAQQPG